jgi:prolyl oligopeptidase
MAAQDSLTRAELKKLPRARRHRRAARELFYRRRGERAAPRSGRYFYTRRHATKEKSVVYWKQGKQGAEKVLFDPNEWSTDGSVSLGGWDISWDGKTVAYRSGRTTPTRRRSI